MPLIPMKVDGNPNTHWKCSNCGEFYGIVFNHENGTCECGELLLCDDKNDCMVQCSAVVSGKCNNSCTHNKPHKYMSDGSCESFLCDDSMVKCIPC